MYIPKPYEEKDQAEIEALVREFGFATIVSNKDGLPVATHIPFELEVQADGSWLLNAHLSKANPQWKTFETAGEVLVIFMGPHTYVSPSWYNHKNVPTWNYRAVHIYGTISLVEGEQVEKSLRTLMARYENAHASKPLSYEEIPAKMLETDLRGLVGIQVKVNRIEAVAKLSQNRDKESYQSVIDHLKQVNAYDAARIAEEMEKRKKD